MENKNSALDDLEQMIDHSGGSALTADWDSLISQAKVFLDKGESKANYVLAKANLGKADFVNGCKGKYTESLNLYNDAISADSTFGEAYVGRALLYERHGDKDKAAADREQALVLLERQLKQYPSDAKVLLNRARLFEALGDNLQAAGDLDLALDILVMAIEDQPDRLNLFQLRAEVLQLRGWIAYQIEEEQNTDLDYQERQDILKEFQKRALMNLNKSIELIRFTKVA